jgi:hypothetical protein
MCCVITDENHVVKSVSLIPGLAHIPSDWHCYFPFMGDFPEIGTIYKPQKEQC